MGEQGWRYSRKLVVLVVMVALFLDFFSVTVIVPIVPDYLTKASTNKVGVEISSENISNSDAIRSTEIGILFSAKALVEFFVGPFVGALTNRIGCTIPMLLGFFVMFMSTLIFAFADTYALMLVARCLQGVGLPFSTVAGLTMLVLWYPDDKERGVMLSRAYSVGSLGFIVGPLFGGFMYQNFGKTTPFLIVAGLALIDGGLRFLIVDQKSESSHARVPSSLKSLLKDPHILLAVGAYFLLFSCVGTLEPLQPLHMMKNMQASSFEQGIVLAPNGVGFFIGSNILGHVSHRMGRHKATMTGLVLVGCSLIMISLSQNVVQLMLANAAFGLAFSLVQSAIVPLITRLVDLRHSRVYGHAFAIIKGSSCLAFFVGPLFGGFAMDKLGFEWVLWILSILCFSYALFFIFLWNSTMTGENQPLLNENVKRDGSSIHA